MSPSDPNALYRLSQTLRNRLSGPLGHYLLSHRSDDIYLAAFPRSGSTWLRTILVNILDAGANSNPDVFNARFPAVSIRNAKLINALESPRYIMTHSSWRPSIKHAVYLIRDGRDAFISSYHYHVTRNNLQMDVGRYYQLYKAGTYGPTWEYHTLKWLQKARDQLGDKFHVVHFEDLKANTLNVAQDVCDFMQISTETKALSNAIDIASLENARKIERQRQGVIDDQNASFYRQGKSRQWQNPEYKEVIQLFESDSENALELAGYQLSY